jgi:NADH dehydrogenase [ubiquinone] 1 alpha subcomplex assembly factor 6
MTILSRSLRDSGRGYVAGLLNRETRRPSPRSGAAADTSSLADLVRRHDRDRFQTALFAPEPNRQALFALYGFNYEIARVREIVREPMLGQIRLQWWREVIATAFDGEAPRRHEIVLPLSAAIRDFSLSRECFDRLIDTRERDLDPEPPSTLAVLEAYAEGTSAALVVLALEVLGVRNAAALKAGGEVGTGYALAGLIRAMPFHTAGQRCYIPTEIEAEVGLNREDYDAGRATPALRAAVGEIAAAALRHLRAARADRGAIPRTAIPALLPAIIATRFLRRLERVGYDPFDRRLAVPDTLQSWRLAAAALFGRY